MDLGGDDERTDMLIKMLQGGGGDREDLRKENEDRKRRDQELAMKLQKEY